MGRIKEIIINRAKVDNDPFYKKSREKILEHLNKKDLGKYKGMAK